MAFPVTLNGRTYTLADFSGTTYVEGFPDALEDFVTQAGDIYNSTSTTSNAISTGAKTFTVEASKPYQAGTPLRIADAAAPATNFLDAIVTSYSGTSLVVSVFGIVGSGTYTSWTVNIGGAKTVDGTLAIAQGGTGATTAANARTNLGLGAADSPSFAGLTATGAGGISSNTAVGNEALSNNTTGGGNTANGLNALLSNTTGNGNTANGRDTLRDNTTGSNNTANGFFALLNNTGSNNTANGRDALQNNTTGFQNTANGVQALQNNTTGGNNIGIGLNAGGSTSPRTITTASNEICIGNNNHTGAFIKIAFTVTSDARDKAELAPIPHGLDFVNALQPTEYQFKAGGRDGEADGIRRYGFLAQDVLAAEGDNPVIVNNDDPDSLKMTHDYIIPVLVNAVKELTAQVNDLMAEVTALKGQ